MGFLCRESAKEYIDKGPALLQRGLECENNDDDENMATFRVARDAYSSCRASR